jgi:hypothetical protein
MRKKDSFSKTKNKRNVRNDSWKMSAVKKWLTSCCKKKINPNQLNKQNNGNKSKIQILKTKKHFAAADFDLMES